MPCSPPHWLRFLSDTIVDDDHPVESQTADDGFRYSAARGYLRHSRLLAYGVDDIRRRGGVELCRADDGNRCRRVLLEDVSRQTRDDHFLHSSVTLSEFEVEMRCRGHIDRRDDGLVADVPHLDVEFPFRQVADGVFTVDIRCCSPRQFGEIYCHTDEGLTAALVGNLSAEGTVAAFIGSAAAPAQTRIRSRTDNILFILFLH